MSSSSTSEHAPERSGAGPSSRSRSGQLRRWALGLTVGTARYLLHRVPLYRRNRRDDTSHAPPDLPRALPGDASTLQRADDGVGSLFHRHYSIAFTDGTLDPAGVIAQLVEDPNRATPNEFSEFQSRDGRHGPIEVGDELVVRLPGPWDGPVRVVDRTDTSFRLATLQGHMEAGEIEFSARRTDRGWVAFEIESWARSGDRFYEVLYERLPFARELQLHMWSEFCLRVVGLADGIPMTSVELHSCQPDDGDGTR